MESDAQDRRDIPAGYREILYWRISDKRWRVVLMTLLGLLSLPLWFILFSWLSVTIGRAPQTTTFGLPQLVVVLVGGLLTVVLHEVVHGLAMKAFGARPRFGVLWYGLMAYATAPGHAFTRSAYLIIILAPLVSISLLAVLGMILLAGTPWVSVLALYATVNAAGAVGDLWIVGIVLRYPPTAQFIDERDGVRVLVES